jgi:KAP family P-loop domain
MYIFPPTLNIGDKEGFSFEKDIFGRAAMGQGLTNLVRSIENPIVMAVDGQWGSGKTVFLKMWAGKLRQENFPVIYFDAFENDYAEDAFTAIASEIIALTEEKNKGNKPVVEKLVEHATGAGKILLRSSLKIGIKAATLGVLDGDEFKDIEKDIAAETSKLWDQHIGELLTKQIEQKETMETFRKTLSDLPPLLLDEKNDSGEKEAKPLIFIIDELDRCRPSFALEILERVKHFFNVSNVHFVLGINLKQLQKSVTTIYGSNNESSTYLDKFINFTFYLDKNHHRQNHQESTSKKFIDYLLKSMAFTGEDLETAKRVTYYISRIAENKNLSLRTIERIFTILALAISYSTKNSLRIAPILGGLCVLKIVEPELYKKASLGELQYSDVEKLFGLKSEKNEFGEYAKDTRWWRYSTGLEVDQSFSKRVGRANSSNHDIESGSEIPQYIAHNLIDRFSAGQ